jgi:hypothetical protein
MWMLFACVASMKSPLPLAAEPEPDLTLVWVGTGTAWRHENGDWVRTPQYDYEFTVVQRRFPDRWSSVKQVHRYSPEYDGAAGERDPLWHFAIGYRDEGGSSLAVAVDSSLGDGTGTADRSFRSAELDLAADVSAAAPFDHYRIRQTYDYEAGELREEVLLYERDGDEEVPYVRNDERATLFGPTRFAEPPTRR